MSRPHHRRRIGVKETVGQDLTALQPRHTGSDEQLVQAGKTAGGEHDYCHISGVDQLLCLGEETSDRCTQCCVAHRGERLFGDFLMDAAHQRLLSLSQNHVTAVRTTSASLPLKQGEVRRCLEKVGYGQHPLLREETLVLKAAAAALPGHSINVLELAFADPTSEVCR